MLVISATGVKGDAAVDYVRMSLVVTGVSTLLQCLTRGTVGSRYPRVPHLPAPIFSAPPFSRPKPAAWT